MPLTKPTVLPTWASEAPDNVQPTSPEIQAGWPSTNTPPARQRWNWLLNWLMNGVRYLTRRGIADYGADEVYMTGDCVIGDDGKTYRSTIDNNTNHTPSTDDGSHWERWGWTKSELDTYISGKQVAFIVRAASTAAINLAAPGAAIDGVTMADGDKFLEKDNGTGSARGIYVWNGAAAPATRAPEADTGAELKAGILISVTEGTANADTLWELATDGQITVGVTALSFLKTTNSNVGTPGTYTKVTTDVNGRVVAGTTLSAGDIPNLDWAKITSGKPTTLAGYGITDGNLDGWARDNILLLFLRSAITSSIASGAMRDGMSDAYLTDTIGATSTNQTYDSTNKLYSNPGGPVFVPAATGAVIGTATNLANAFDGNTSQAYAATAPSVAGSGLLTLYAGKDWGAGNTKTISRFKVYATNDYNGFNTAGGSTMTIKLQGSNDNSSWTDLYSVSGVAATASSTRDVTTGINTSTAYRYHRVVLYEDSPYGGSHGVMLAEVEFYTPGTPANMTLVPVAATAQASPGNARIVVLHKAVDATTINTDFTAEVSRDGVTWSAVTLSDLGAYDSNFNTLEGTVAFSGAAGTSMKYRLKTLNNKSQQVKGCAFSWG